MLARWGMLVGHSALQGQLALACGPMLALEGSTGCPVLQQPGHTLTVSQCLTLLSGTTDTGMGGGMTRSVTYLGTQAGSSAATAGGWMALALAEPRGSCSNDCSFCSAGSMRGTWACGLGVWWAAAGLNIPAATDVGASTRTDSRIAKPAVTVLRSMLWGPTRHKQHGMQQTLGKHLAALLAAQTRLSTLVEPPPCCSAGLAALLSE